ncbi:DUF1949 domain-containing protein, partial [Pseudomonas aeruginosa]|nr:DUF1949 domain-containing protein [Pseudomonas aeruginosa]
QYRFSDDGEPGGSASVAAEDYGADGVVLTLELPVARFEALQALLVDLSRGQVRPQRLDA